MTIADPRVFVSTVQAGVSFGDAVSPAPFVTVSVDRLTALQRAARHVQHLSALRFFDEGQEVPGTPNPHLCAELHQYVTLNPLTDDLLEDAFKLQVWLTDMNDQCGEPWFAIQLLDVLTPQAGHLRAAV